MERGVFRRPRPHARATPRRRAVRALLAALAFAVPCPALAQAGTDSQAADAQVILLNPGTIVRATDMDFGKIARPAAPGSVVLTPVAAPTCNTTGGLVHTGDCRAAQFDGDMNLFFFLRITRPAGGQINLVGPGGSTMRLNNFTFGGTTGLLAWGSTATEQRYLVLSADGRFTFHVGGTLQVSANQTPGAYTGTFALQFNYD